MSIGSLFKTSKEIKILVTFLLVTSTIMGYFPNGYSVRKKQFIFSPLLLIYSIIGTITFAIIYLGEIYQDYINDRIDIKDAVQLYYYMNIGASLIDLIVILIQSKEIRDFLNQVQFYKTIEFFDLSSKTRITASIIVGLKTIIFPLVLEVSFILKNIKDETQQSLLWTLYKLYPTLLSGIPPNCHFGILTMAAKIMAQLNSKMEQIRKEVNFLQTDEQINLHKSYYRMKTFCKLADQLDTLKEKYNIICEQSLTYCNLVACPLVCALICNLFGITAGFYMQYTALADSLIDKDAYDIYQAVINLIFLIISLSDVAMQAFICNNIWEEVQQTGFILQQMTLDRCDIRFKQSVESFTLLILTTKFTIKPLGLFEINVSLIHDVIATVASFLLILVQTDMSLRFTLQ